MLSSLKRPQEPLRPYPYDEEDVVYENREAGVELAGTLVVPQGPGPFPAAIIIAGTGPHERDAIKGGHRTFLVLADYLVRQGIAVLRYDKRGCGASSGNYAVATSVDFASDVQAGIRYLRSREEISNRHIGLIGHSEGGIITSMIAAKSPDLAFAVILAGPGVVGEELLYEECAVLARAMGEAEETIAAGTRLLAQMCSVIKSEGDAQGTKEQIEVLYTEYLSSLSEDQKDAAKDSVFHEAVELMISNPLWLRFFLTFEPASALKKVKIPVLALFCELDLLVPSYQNLQPFREALEAAGNDDFTIMEMAGLNHRFQHCKIGTEQEYAEIEETMAPEVLELVSAWIVARTS